MPFLTPVLSVPSGAGSAPESLAAGTCLVNEPAGNAVDVEVAATGATVAARPYFWQPVPGHPDGGAWVPLGGDGVAGIGTSPVTALAGARAHGRFQHSVRGPQSWILVLETGAVVNVSWAFLEVVDRYGR